MSTSDRYDSKISVTANVENSIHYLGLAILHLFLKICWCSDNLKQMKKNQKNHFLTRIYSYSK